MCRCSKVLYRRVILAYNKEIRNKFIELRTLGKSINEIVKILSISKRTLLKWNEEYKWEISDLADINEEELIFEESIRIKNKIKFLNDEIEKAYAVLVKRKYDELSPADLLRIIDNYEISLKLIVPQSKNEEKPELRVEVVRGSDQDAD